MQGYAGLHQAQNSTSAEQGKQAVQTAVGHLFQAMAVFHTANQPTQYGQQKDLTDSCNMIKHVIHDILVGLTGSSDRPGPQVTHSALTALSRHPRTVTANKSLHLAVQKATLSSQPHCSLFVYVEYCSASLCAYMLLYVEYCSPSLRASILLLKAVLACAVCLT